MSTATRSHGALLRRVIAFLIAVMFAFGPTTIVSANAAIPSHQIAQKGDVAFLFDDTPDIGVVRDAPPPLVGGVNLYFAGVIPDELASIELCLSTRPLWHAMRTATLSSCVPNQLQRPPRRV